MRLAALLLTLLMSVSCMGANPHSYTHRLETTLADASTDGCSGTAIGPHAIMTAEHCEADGALTIDDTPVTVVKKIHDNFDHSILLLKGVTFGQWASVTTEGLKQGDVVTYWGNPDDFIDQYRFGHVAGYSTYEGKPITLLDLNGGRGDSGAGLFNQHGKLAGVVNMKVVISQDFLTFMIAYPLHFTKNDLKEAERF